MRGFFMSIRIYNPVGIQKDIQVVKSNNNLKISYKRKIAFCALAALAFFSGYYLLAAFESYYCLANCVVFSMAGLNRYIKFTKLPDLIQSTARKNHILPVKVTTKTSLAKFQAENNINFALNPQVLSEGEYQLELFSNNPSSCSEIGDLENSSYLETSFESIDSAEYSYNTEMSDNDSEDECELSTEGTLSSDQPQTRACLRSELDWTNLQWSNLEERYQLNFCCRVNDINFRVNICFYSGLCLTYP